VADGRWNGERILTEWERMVILHRTAKAMKGGSSLASRHATATKIGNQNTNVALTVTAPISKIPYLITQP
jgi:hypothetical protein